MGAALFVIRSRNAIHSAIWLVVSFLSIAGLYVLLEAEFVAVVQVLVYAGGIMVLFLFVIMLVNLRDAAPMRPRLPAAVSALVGILAIGAILLVVRRGSLPPAGGDSALRTGGNLQAVGEAMFRDYLLPFEIASVLLLVAMVGAILLARQPGRGAE
ncbi:MAG TPA: NADH-quinone oxidoreductase subunit J [Candidatus Polarisedimenticolia bacterium]|nr:NADH-quinone oxidoreductase subunit J [Candidatus Polarisedimenticolia bacterium]